MRISTVKLCDGQYQPSEFWDFFDCIRKAVFHSREATCLKWATQPWALTAKSNCLTWEVPPIDGTRWTTTPHTLALKVSLCPSHLPITYFCEASKTSVHKRQLLEGWQPYFQLTFSNFMKSRGCHCLELSCHWMKEMNQPHGGVKGFILWGPWKFELFGVILILRAHYVDINKHIQCEMTMNQTWKDLEKLSKLTRWCRILN